MVSAARTVRELQGNVLYRIDPFTYRSTYPHGAATRRSQRLPRLLESTGDCSGLVTNPMAQCLNVRQNQTLSKRSAMGAHHRVTYINVQNTSGDIRLAN